MLKGGSLSMRKGSRCQVEADHAASRISAPAADRKHALGLLSEASPMAPRRRGGGGGGVKASRREVWGVNSRAPGAPPATYQIPVKCVLSRRGRGTPAAVCPSSTSSAIGAHSAASESGRPAWLPTPMSSPPSRRACSIQSGTACSIVDWKSRSTGMVPPRAALTTTGERSILSRWKVASRYVTAAPCASPECQHAR
eukprot:scaffold92825_cov66-Phaeocystis_antarctica.AAC.3